MPAATGPAGDEPLGLTVHGLPRPGEALVRQRQSGRWKMLMVLAVCAAPVLLSYFMYYVVRPGASTAYGTLIQPTRPMPALQARTLDGQPLALRDLRGQWLLVVVAGGACGADCERQLFLQRQLREMTGRERERIDKLWLIPDGAEPPPALREALAATPALTIARVDPAALAAWLQPASGHALAEHLYLVDPMGDWMMRMPAQADPARVKRDLERLLRASAGWDQPGRQEVRDGQP
ncbi:SCO family protein [Pseudaquabacterium rugosum]|uniref:Cytochrome oxidase assembly protein n=1 Tax=Pseudaquabacterium rugosum TaxID=2984194 RepID=A0ABU9B4F2_9BURK